MTRSGSTHEQVEALILEFLAGATTVEDERRLASVLQHDRSARELFASYLRIEGAAADLFAQGSPRVEDSAAHPRAPSPLEVPPLARRSPQRSMRAWLRIPSMTASLLILGSVLYWAWQRASLTPSMDDGDRADTVVARVIRNVDAQWITPPPAADGWIEPGRLELASGLVEIAFEGGNTVILEGPVACELESTNHATLERGKLRGVSQGEVSALLAHWRTPTLDIAESGSEFAIDVDANGATECHVFTGEATIAARTVQSDRMTTWLTAGQAARIDEHGETTPMDADRESFADLAEMEPFVPTQQSATALTSEPTWRHPLAERRRQLWSDESLAPLRAARDAARTARRELVQQAANTESARAHWRAAQESVRAMVTARLNEDPRSLSLLQQLTAIQHRLNELRQERRAGQRSPTTAVATDRAPWQEFQSLHRERREVQRQLQLIRRRIRESDPEVRALLARVRNAWKMSMDESTASRLQEAETALETAQQALQQAHQELVRRDPAARALRQQAAKWRASTLKKQQHSPPTKDASPARNV